LNGSKKYKRKIYKKPDNSKHKKWSVYPKQKHERQKTTCNQCQQAVYPFKNATLLVFIVALTINNDPGISTHEYFYFIYN